MPPSVRQPTPPMRRAPAGYQILDQHPGLFGDIFVVERDGRRRMRFASAWGIDQSLLDLRRPERPPAAYLRALGLASRLHPSVRRVLLRGLGGGGAVRLLQTAAPGCRIVAIEADGAVITLARQWFDVRPGPALEIIEADVREFLRGARSSAAGFDLILHDLYDEDAMPLELTTEDLFGALRDRLAPGGLLIVNLGMPSEARERPIVRRFAGIFPQPGCEFRMPADHNRLLIGSQTPFPGAADIRRLARRLDRERAFAFPVLPYARRYHALPKPRARRPRT